MTSRAEGLKDENRPGDPSPGPPGRSFIPTVNGGSPGLKFAPFDRADPPARRAAGRIERIGLAGTRPAAIGVGGSIREAAVEASDHRATAGLLVERVDREVGLPALAAVGHRVVHVGRWAVRSPPASSQRL